MNRARSVRNNIETNSSKSKIETQGRINNSNQMTKGVVKTKKNVGKSQTGSSESSRSSESSVSEKTGKAGKTGKTSKRSATNGQTITEYQKNRMRLKDSLPWVEKYRPRRIDNVSLDINIKRQLKRMIKDRDVRNIILEGPSGVGKTSTVQCIAREIFGKYYSRKVLEINASDDRGIKIQNPIEIFNRAYVHIEEEDIGKIPNFKLVILDEADNMTDKAKHNITKFIETNKKGVRFAFTCNSKDNISTAIQSRCHIINYPKLENSFVIRRLMEICHAEGIINEDTDKNTLIHIERGIFAISEIADGDLRIAVNTLQLTYDRYKTIDSEKVYGTYDKPHPEQSRDIIRACIQLDLARANRLMMEMIYKGFSVTDITAGLNVSLRQSICQNIPNAVKIGLIEKISYSQYNVSQGLELSHIQARGCIADICDAVRKMDQKLIDKTQKQIDQDIAEDEKIKSKSKTAKTTKTAKTAKTSEVKSKSKANAKAKPKPKAKAKSKGVTKGKKSTSRTTKKTK